MKQNLCQPAEKCCDFVPEDKSASGADGKSRTGDYKGIIAMALGVVRGILSV